ncbi:MAG: N-acetyl-D-Glu racemase DgcA [Thermodesulfobacteriota bacterium]|nr:N-acetyl-D-Glu racemase DgcA [Thermodesulfobacteriota bacterium]
MKRLLRISIEKWPIRGVFRISRGSSSSVKVVVVELEQDGCIGRGEASPERYGMATEIAVAEMETVRDVMEQGCERSDLQNILPPGPVRNGLDLALWDLETKLTGRPVWDLAGLEEWRPVLTAWTVSLDTPERMLQAAKQHQNRPLLKIKLTGESDLERLQAVRKGAPEARLIVDANESWSGEYYQHLVPRLVELGIELIEQPFPAASDEILAELSRPIPVCADESCRDRSDLQELVKLYDYINIKLDKTGGLTEALRLQQQARRLNLGVMVGCMVSTSLGIAPALLLARDADFIDLDGHLLLARDREPGLECKEHLILPPQPELWG